jgi:diguanylate cyclase (GGDEF)-like protein/hemerythrin-like metal-binding protein/PAS domain S-box-containing protein
VQSTISRRESISHKPQDEVKDPDHPQINLGLEAPEIDTATTVPNLDAMAAFEKREQFRLGFEVASIGIGLVDLKGNIFEANECLAETLGIPVTEIKSTNLMDICAPEERLPALADFQKASRTGKFTPVFERRFFNKRGGFLLAQVTRGLVRNRVGEPIYFTISVRDITQERLKEVLLEQQASTDPLTGAVNRTRLEEKAKFELMKSDRYGNPLSLVMIDLDHFKAVNDTYGHGAGDRVLRGFCEMAKACLRSVDILGRWGSEEFVAILPEATLAGAHIVADRLRNELAATEFSDGIRVTASMGVAIHREDEEFASLIERADACMYRAKGNGRNQVVIDTDDDEREAASEQLVSPLLALHWKPSYESGQIVIDTQHRELFQMANRIIAAITGGAANGVILDSVHALVNLVGVHFRDEENILQSAGFPDAQSHGKLHRQLFEEAGKLTSQFERGEGSEGSFLRFLFHDVIAKHMLQEDRKFISWFQAKVV